MVNHFCMNMYIAQGMPRTRRAGGASAARDGHRGRVGGSVRPAEEGGTELEAEVEDGELEEGDTELEEGEEGELEEEGEVASATKREA